MANSSASTITGLAYGLAKVESTSISTPSLQTTQMLQWLNNANAEWRELFRISGEPTEAMRKEDGFTLSTETTLSADASEGDTTLSVTDSTLLPSAGAAVVWTDDGFDVIEYTSSAANVLSGVTGIDVDTLLEGSTISAIYALPSNFDDFRAVEGAPHGVMVDGPHLQTSGVPIGNQFALYDNGTSTYIIFPKGQSGKATIFYNRASTTIDEATDVVDVPVKHQMFLVYRLVAHIKRVQRDLQSAQYFDALADKEVSLAQKAKNLHKIIRTRPILRRRVINNLQVTPLDTE